MNKRTRNQLRKHLEAAKRNLDAARIICRRAELIFDDGNHAATLVEGMLAYLYVLDEASRA